MAKKLDPRLLEILTTYGERPEDALWDCHGTWVAYHAAIERIAAKADIVFEMPMIIEANSANKTVAIAVKGKMGDNEDYREEWSFGEAAPTNNKNSYPYAMAEKRAKDRVVLKLIGLHGLAYSEEESDSFKPEPANDAPKRQVGWSKDGTTRTANSLKKEKGPDTWDAFRQELAEVVTTEALRKLTLSWAVIIERDAWPENWKDLAREEIQKRREAIINAPIPDEDDTEDRSNSYADNYSAG
jgi:hypothetical protein